MTKFYKISNKSFSELGVASYKELWDKVKTEHQGLCVGVDTEFVQQKAEDGKDENKFTVIMSSATEDRHGDIVVQEWDLKSFKKNPVFLDSHNYGSIEHILGKFKKVYMEDGKLKGDVEFMLDNPKGLLAYKMAQQGFLNATSVGFIPKEFDDKGRILKSELLENSAVSVPANAEALFERKSIDEVIADVEVPEVQPTVPVEEVEPTEEVIDSEEAEKELIEDIIEEAEDIHQNILDAVKARKAERQKKLDALLAEIRGISPDDSEKRKLFKHIRSLV
jgi:hypothetical protein